MLQAATEGEKKTPISQRQWLCTSFKNYMCYQVFMSPSERPCGTWEWRTKAQQKGAVCFNRCVPGEADGLRVSGWPACRAEEGSGSINGPDPPLLYSQQTTDTLTAVPPAEESNATVKLILQLEVISAVDHHHHQSVTVTPQGDVCLSTQIKAGLEARQQLARCSVTEVMMQRKMQRVI